MRTLHNQPYIHLRKFMKKILILTSNGGGGTLSASTAIAEYLQNDHQVTTAHVFNDLLKSIDFCGALTLGYYTCEDVYNFFIPRKCFRMLTLLYHVGKWYIRLQQKSIRRILHPYFVQNNFSLIISVVPLINPITLSLAEELNIPFLLIPTDLDVHMYIQNISNPTYKKFHIGLPFQDKDVMESLKQTQIDKKYISIVGAPLRHDFFTPKNIPALKKEYNIPENKPIIMILMGAQGSHDIIHYIKELIKIPYPMHLIICTGKNGKQLPHVKFPEHITMTTIKFTSRIADLMAFSDIIITKSGSLSVCEAIYMETPVILDATSTVLPWEQFNHTFIKNHQFGTSIKKYCDIRPLITELLQNPEKLIWYKSNLKSYKKENIEREVKELVCRLLN